MPQVDFYHLESDAPEDVLLKLVAKSIDAGRKVLVQCPRPAAEGIDDALWSKDPESWIPHGLDDAEGAGRSQVWIVSNGEANPLNAEFLFLMHGAERADMSGFERVFNLFAGNSQTQLDQARTQWKSWKADKRFELRYMKQDDTGKWQISG